MNSETICHGCLSRDRKVLSADSYMSLLLYLFKEERQILCNLAKGNIQLCWECIAILKKMKSFQNRMKNAQFLLLSGVFQIDYKVDALSNLCTKQNYSCDFIIEYEERNLLDTPFNKIKVEDDEDLKVAYQLSPKQDNLDSDVDCPSYNSDWEVKQENDNFEINKKKRKCLKTKQEYTKFFTKIKCSEYVQGNQKKYFRPVLLTEAEMEDFLKHDMKLHGYRRLKHKCNQCRIAYMQPRDLKRHKDLNHQTSSFRCTECKKSLPSRSSLESHWLSHSMLYKCQLCGDLYKLGALKKHLKYCHTFIYRCKACGDDSRNIKEFMVHYTSKHEIYICDHCGQKRRSKKNMEKHMLVVHLPRRCAECGEMLRSSKALRRHMRIRHAPPASRPYCVECDRHYASEARYREHLSQTARHRTQPKPKFPCPECGKNFSRTLYMNNHLRLVHTKQYKFHCQLCDKPFATGFGLRNHKKFVHEKAIKPKNKMCDLCGRGFSTNRILDNHRRTHTGERPFQCAHCPAAFAQKTALNSHSRTQHKAQ